jgi:hypothetical protein
VVALVRWLLFDWRGRAAFALGPTRLRGMRDGALQLRQRLAPDEPPVRLPLLARHTLWAFLGICGFAVIFLHRQMAAMYSVPDLGDPLLSIWRMGWFGHWLHGDPRPLFSPNIFYPEPLTLTFSDAMLLPALFGVPLLAAGLHPVVVYNVLFMGAFVASGLAMYCLAVRLTASPPAAFVSAILFGFYPFRFEHYSHLELQWTMWMPLALLALHAFIERQRVRDAIATAVLIVAQLYSSMYFAVFFCLYLVPVSAWLIFVKRTPLRRLWRGAVAAAVCGIVLALPLARPYMQAQSRKGVRPVEEVAYYSATMKDYVSAHPRSISYYGTLPHPEPERALFPGVVSIGLTAVALFPPAGAVRLAYGAGLLLAVELSRGMNGAIYPLLYEWSGTIRGMRVPARFSLIAGMSLCLLAGFGCARMFARVRSTGASAIVLGAVLALAFLDLRGRVELVPVWREPPAVYSAVAGRPNVVLAEFPWWSDRPEIGPQFPFMYFSLWHWTNMTNGASGFEPPHYQDYLVDIHRFPEPGAIDALKARGVTHVTINCALYAEERNCHGVLDELDQSPRFQRVSSAMWEGDRVVLYALVN